MYYLAIETSCDETSLALLKNPGVSYQHNFVEYINSLTVESSVISSQVDVHREFGGVVPEIGARRHADHIHMLFGLLLSKTGQGATSPLLSGEMPLYTHFQENISLHRSILSHIQGIMVTSSPGLPSALKVGVEFARSLCFYLTEAFGQEVPLHMVNHLHGHIVSCFRYDSVLENTNDYQDNGVFPHLHLLVSGGNTQLLLLESPSTWQVVSQTLDDAAGESFDKTGRLLGLPYPAGVLIARIAGLENKNYHNLPRGMLKNKSLDFSYSGLKTAVRYYIQKQDVSLPQKLSDEQLVYLVNTDLVTIADPVFRFVKEMCISIQSVIVEQLVRKTKQAIAQYQPHSLGLSGGVSANKLLRKQFGELHGQVYVPPQNLTGDNATMIGLAGISNLI